VPVVRFTEDKDVRDHLGRVVQSFRAGQVVELSAASARRWLRRHAAVEVQGAADPAPAQLSTPPPAPSENHGPSPRRRGKRRARTDAVGGSGDLGL
jgi:hypothetical protein